MAAYLGSLTRPRDGERAHCSHHGFSFSCLEEWPHGAGGYGLLESWSRTLAFCRAPARRPKREEIKQWGSSLLGRVWELRTHGILCGEDYDPNEFFISKYLEFEFNLSVKNTLALWTITINLDSPIIVNYMVLFLVVHVKFRYVKYHVSFIVPRYFSDYICVDMNCRTSNLASALVSVSTTKKHAIWSRRFKDSPKVFLLTTK